MLTGRLKTIPSLFAAAPSRRRMPFFRFTPFRRLSAIFKLQDPSLAASTFSLVIGIAPAPRAVVLTQSAEGVRFANRSGYPCIGRRVS